MKARRKLREVVQEQRGEVCACGWEIPIVFRIIGRRVAGEVMLCCPVCNCPHRVRVRMPEVDIEVPPRKGMVLKRH